MKESTFLKKGRGKKTNKNQLAPESQPSRKEPEIQIWKGRGS